MQAVLRFADGDVEHHELADRDARGHRVEIERHGRQLHFYLTRRTPDGRPVFIEDPTAAIVTT